MEIQFEAKMTIQINGKIRYYLTNSVETIKKLPENV